MRWLVIGFGLWGATGCNQVDHPPAIEPCDPETMMCSASADSGGGHIGSGNGTDGDGWAGDIIEFTDDTFYRGSAYTGSAIVSAYDSAGVRTEVPYDGDRFIFEDLEAANPNWFIVDPEDAGLFTTVQPIDTDRSPADLTLGVSPEFLADQILELVDSERIDRTAQVVLRVVSAGGDGLAGARAAYGAAVYRDGGTWTMAEGASTDDSGLILLANLGVSSLSFTDISLTGSIEESVEILIAPDSLTVADVPFY